MGSAAGAVVDATSQIEKSLTRAAWVGGHHRCGRVIGPEKLEGIAADGGGDDGEIGAAGGNACNDGRRFVIVGTVSAGADAVDA